MTTMFALNPITGLLRLSNTDGTMVARDSLGLYSIRHFDSSNRETSFSIMSDCDGRLTMISSFLSRAVGTLTSE